MILPALKIKSFNPTERVLMGPGPSDVSDRVLRAMASPTLGHLDPEFISMMNETKELLQYVFQTKNEWTFAVSAPGSAGMECCFANLIESGDKVIVCQNGVFGGRMRENVERCGGEAIMVNDKWGCPVDLEKVEMALKEHPDASIVAFVHAETSTGVESDVQNITKLAHEHGCIVIVDSVTGLVGSELRVDEWEIDAIYSGTQKCLSAPPGLSPISFNERAAQKIKSRTSKVQSWFLDLNLIMGYWAGDNKRSYHHTAPVNCLYGLHEALLMVNEEGLEQSWQRHRENHLLLKEGLSDLDIDFLVDSNCRLPQLNAVVIPDHVDDGIVRSKLLNDFNLEIGAGLGDLAGRVWRIGLMGHASNPKNIEYCLSALKSVL